MLVVRYSKTDGAEFISHLDTLRHIQKTIVRAELPVAYSKGFNPHMQIFMSSPIALGLASFAEYFFIESDADPEVFKREFTRCSPKGLRCLLAKSVSKNPNLAAVIDGARYVIKDVPAIVDEKKILAAEEYFVTDKRGARVDVRGKIKSIDRSGSDLICRFASGNSPLRADLFVSEIEKEYGIELGDVVKTDSYIGWVEVENCI